MTIWDIDLGWFVMGAVAVLGVVMIAMELHCTAKKVGRVMDALDEEEK